MDNCPADQDQRKGCCTIDCYRPFESDVNSCSVPAALYLNVICRSLNLPEEHTIIVLALIERFCNTASSLDFQNQDGFYKRFYDDQSRNINA